MPEGATLEDYTAHLRAQAARMDSLGKMLRDGPIAEDAPLQDATIQALGSLCISQAEVTQALAILLERSAR